MGRSLISNQMGPLLLSLEVLLKIPDDTLDETGNRIYLNDGAKAEVIARSVYALLKPVAEIAFEAQPSLRSCDKSR